MLGAIFKITKPGHVVVAELFVGVPTAVSFSRFLSLIRVRLLSDPEHTDSPHFVKNHRHVNNSVLGIRFHSGCWIYFQLNLALYIMLIHREK